MVSESLPYWLAIYRYEGIGPQRFAHLLSQTTDVKACFDGERPTRAFVDWGKAHGVRLQAPDWAGVERDLAWATSPHHTILTWESPAYPPLLKAASGAPPILFVQGAFDCLSSQQVAIVGTRHPTVEGLKNARAFSYALAKHAITVTSGLALGIDGCSHEAALAAGGKTIAVMGTGLDTIYPAKHQRLAEKIAAQGALVSEFPIGVPPRPAHFPRRNRVISGLACGVLVVEAAVKSGSLITAQYALEQGREVFALPGSIHNPLAKGCHALIRQGAKCVEGLSHILEEIPLVRIESNPSE